MHTLTAKLLNENLKKGWTEEDFADYLNITEPQFFYLLKKNFNSKFSESVIKQLKKNQKKRKKVEKPDTAKEPEVTGDTSKTEESITANEVDNNNSIQQNEEISKTQETNITLANSDKVINIKLEELLDKERVFQKELCDCENNLKSLHSKRKGLNSKLEYIQNKIKDLIHLANSYSKAVNDISDEIDILSEEIEIQNSDIRQRQENLSNIRAQIQSLKKITIYAYLNGTFEVENSDTEISIPETWEQVCAEIVKYEVLESLTLKQIKLLAKLYAITHMLSKDNLEYELIFESEELQSCFSLLYK